MGRGFRTCFVRACFLTLTALLTICLRSPARADPVVGEPAPALVVEELDGNSFDLSEERGKVTVVNFWATWCEPCRKEIPAIEAVFRRYHDQGLEVIALSADRRHERSNVIEMAKSFGYPAAMLDDTTSNGFGSPTELPVTFIIDRNSVLRERFTPEKSTLTEQSLTEAVVPLLEQKAEASSSSAEPKPPEAAHKSLWKRLFRE